MQPSAASSSASVGEAGERIAPCCHARRPSVGLLDRWRHVHNTRRRLPATRRLPRSTAHASPDNASFMSSNPLPRPIQSHPQTRAPVPASAWAAAWHHSRRQGWRHLWVVGALCLGIAVLLTAIDGRGFFHKLVYSLAIGSVCTLCVETSRLLMAYVSDRVRSAR